MKRGKTRRGHTAAPPNPGTERAGKAETIEEPFEPPEEVRPERVKPVRRPRTEGTLSGNYIGIQSGTSMDGADVALVSITGEPELPVVHLEDSKSFPYPPRLRDDLRLLSDLYALPDSRTAKRNIERERLDLHLQTGDFFADCLLTFMADSGIRNEGIIAIGSHGQTVWHDPPNLSIQIGSPEVIVSRTGIPTVAEFRVADLKEDGQGAPLVPLLDYYLFRHPDENRLLVNIGGICNITYLLANCTKEEVIGFDIGPGNCLIDRYVREVLQSPIGYDPEGAIAARGHVDQKLLDRLWADPFFSHPPPKSADIHSFDPLFQQALQWEATRGANREDIVATLTDLTVTGINLAWILMKSPPIDLVYVTGGGARNRTMFRRIRDLFKGLLKRAAPRVSATLPIGMDGKAKEAVLFALLAHHHLHGIPGNLPQVTGAKNAVVLGTRFDP